MLPLFEQPCFDMTIESEIITEGTGENAVQKKRQYITGPFLQGNVLNKNGRVYPTEMLGETIKNFHSKRMGRGVGAPGELNHPNGVDVNLERVSHYITELKMDGDTGIGKAMIASTPVGRVAQNLLDDGLILGVSTRGLGNVEEVNEKKMVSNFDLVTVDIVNDPSAPDAFVESIMESINYYVANPTSGQNTDKIMQLLESIKSSLTTLPTKTEEKKATLFDIANKAIERL